MKKEETYHGFELGPIRPPSEARSLLLRVTRNCPWNRCTFCGLYKGQRFSIRPVEHVCKDIDTIRYFVDEIQATSARKDISRQQGFLELQQGRSTSDQMAFHAALSWIRGGMRSIFLQDANSLIIKPERLIAILDYLRQTFPQVERITSYARSHTIARISDQDMAGLAGAGLNRIHIGLESGCDEVLDFVKKGVDQKTHIKAGLKVKRAGIELSEYFMPGLGGKRLSRQHALDSAEAMNRINPDFIRIRTLAIPDSLELFKDCQSGQFMKLNDVQAADELLLFFENLHGITSMVKSDHILNLFQESEGRLPEDKDQITAPFYRFLAMKSEEQLLYMVGRRTGTFAKLDDMNDPQLLSRAQNFIDQHGVTEDNIEEFTSEMVKRFI